MDLCIIQQDKDMDFGIGGSKDAEFDAWFVCGKDLEKNMKVVNF